MSQLAGTIQIVAINYISPVAYLVVKGPGGVRLFFNFALRHGSGDVWRFAGRSKLGLGFSCKLVQTRVLRFYIAFKRINNMLHLGVSSIWKFIQLGFGGFRVNH